MDLIRPCVGVSWCAEDGWMLGTDPGIVELGLEADIFALLLILCAQNLEFVGLERRLYVGSICAALAPARHALGSLHGSDGDMLRCGVRGC